MSVSISIAQVIRGVESRMHIPTCTTTSAYTAAEMLESVQEAVKALYALARERTGEEFDTLLDGTLTTVPNTSTISLASLTNFGELWRLAWGESATHLVDLEETPVHRLEPPGFNPRAWASCGNAMPTYRITGADTLRLQPCPSAAYTLHVWYTAHTPVTTANDVIQGRLQWNTWIELDVCWRVATAKKRDGSVFVAERNALAASIFSPNRARAPEARHVIRDVESRGNYRGYDRSTGERY